MMMIILNLIIQIESNLLGAHLHITGILNLHAVLVVADGVDVDVAFAVVDLFMLLMILGGGVRCVVAEVLGAYLPHSSL